MYSYKKKSVMHHANVLAIYRLVPVLLLEVIR